MVILSDLGLRRALLIGGCIVAAVYLGFSIPENPFSAVFLLALVAYFLTLGANARWLAWAFVAFSSSALILPGLPGRPFFWEACAAAAWPSLFVHLGLRRQQFSGIKFGRLEIRALTVLAIYLVNIVVLMLVHGVGFRAFGGQQMGGRFYVQQLILGIIPLLFLVVPWTRRSLLGAFFTAAALTLTYVVSDFALIYGFSSAVGRIVLAFFEVPTDAVNFVLGYEFNGLRRFQSFSSVGMALLLCVLVWLPLRELLGRRALVGMPLLAVALLLGLASGHRTLLVQAVGTVAILGFIQRIYTPPRLAILALVLGVGGILLYSQAARLPMSVQRAVSFLPGIHVDPVAADDAYATLRDRLAVLELGLRDIPKHLLLGRGFGMERLDQRTRGEFDDGILIGYSNGLFPNGTIGLLIKTGLVGFGAALGYVALISAAGVRIVRCVAAIPEVERDHFARFCQVVVAHWFSTVTFYFFLHGEAGTYMTVVTLYSALILVCLRLLSPGEAHVERSRVQSPVVTVSGDRA